MEAAREVQQSTNGRTGPPNHPQVKGPAEFGRGQGSVPPISFGLGVKHDQRQILEKGEGTDEVENVDEGGGQME